MPLRAAARGVLAGCALVALALSACSRHADQPQQLDGWQAVVLPGGMLPSTLVVSGDRLLVGGSRPVGAERAPALLSLPIDGTAEAPTSLPIIPATPYGKVADLVFLTASSDSPGLQSLVAVGAAHGGAHANFRWTIWTGTPKRLVDRPQTFETFGGWEAGTLLGLGTDTRGPLVLGTWQGEHGADGAVWRPDGERWVRAPTPRALANTAQRQVAPQTVSQVDQSVVLNGSVIDLTDGVRQSAAYWRDVDGDWTLTALPDPGSRSLAWSTACAASCWTVGERDAAVVVWSDDGLAPVPPLAADDDDRGVVLAHGEHVVVPVSSHGAGRLLIGSAASRGESPGGSSDDAWRSYTEPDGRVLAAELIGTRLYLVTGTDSARSLWVRDLADVLDR